MLEDLPFIIPEEDSELNLLLILLIIYYLNSTSRGTHILDLERLNIYIYLVKNPHILHKVLIKLNKKSFLLKSYEFSSYKAENNNSEAFYNSEAVGYYIQILASNNLVNIEYNEKVGFVFIPSEDVDNHINVNTTYLKRSVDLINKIKQINSISISKINTEIKNILKEGE